MKKYFGLVIGVLSLLFAAVSCDNFMGGSDLKDELEQIIQHEKADYCKVEIHANIASTTKIGPVAGIYDSTYKPQDSINLSFEPTAAYKFRYWEAHPEGSVKFDNYKELNTRATLLNGNNGESITIEPVCVLRPFPVLSSPNDPINPKNSSITIRFANPLDIPESYLENIKIEIAGEDVSEYFNKPVLQSFNYEIYIASKADKILDFTSGTKIVKVTVPQNFYYKIGDVEVQMAEDGVLEYKINQETIEKTYFSFAKVENGDYTNVSANSTIEKNILEKQIVNFKMKENCLFDKWYITSGDPENESPFQIVEDTEVEGTRLVKKGNTAIVRMIEVDESDATILAANNQYKMTFEILTAFDETIYAYPIVYERPVVTVSPTAKELVAKNTAVTVSFSKPVSNMSEMVSKIDILSEGVSVLENFEEPSYTDTQVTFKAKKTNMINIENNTKTINVSVPKGFIYNPAEGVDVGLKDDCVFSYRINSTTNEKAEISFSAGTYGSTKISINGNRSYNIGDKFTVRVTAEDPTYQFKKWNVATDAGTLPADCLAFEENEDNSLTVTVLDQISGVNIYPVYYKRPVIINFSPVTSNSSFASKDATVVLEFASKIDESFLSEIKITKNNIDITDSFLPPVLSEEDTVVTFSTDYDNLMTVTGASETVIVTVPAEISYKAEDGTVVEAGTVQAKTYKVKNDTEKKLIVTFENSSAGGIMNYTDSYKLSIGDSITVVYTTLNGYNFTGWTIKGATAEVLYDDEELKNSSITLTAKAEGSIVVSGAAVFYPEITDYEPKYNVNGVECDTTVRVFFNTLMAHESFTNSTVSIKNKKTGADLSRYFTINPEDVENITILKLKADASIKELFASNILATYDISISLDKSSIFTQVNSDITLTGINNEWYYRINVGTEQVNPKIKEIHLYKNRDAEGNLSGEMTDLDFENWTQSTFYGEFFQNHTRKVYMKIVGYDADSGLSHINLDERLYRTTAATESSLDPQKRTFGTYTTFKETNETTEDGIELYEYVTEIEFNPLYPDGVMKYDFSLEDRAGNKSDVVTYYIVKDTGVSGNFIKSMNTLNKPRVSVNGIDSVDVLFSPYFNPDYNEDYYKYMVDPFYGSYSDDLKVTKFEWGYLIDDHMTVVEPEVVGISVKENTFSRYQAERGWDWDYYEAYLDYYHIYYSDVAPVMYRFDRDETRETYIRVYVEDSVGNTYVKTVAIPEKATYATTIDGYDYYNAFNLNCPLDYNAQGTGISFYNSNEPDYKKFYAHNGSAWDVRKNKNTLAYYYVGGEPETRYAAYANHYEINGWTIYGTYSDIVDFRPDNVTALTEDDMPSDLEIITSVKNGIKNMGYTEVIAKYPEGFVKNPNLKYFVAVTVEEEDETKTIYTESDVLHLVYGTTYKISPAVRNEAREFKYGKTKTIAVNDDNIPPYMEQKGINNGTHSWYQMAPNFVKTSVPEDASGMKVSEDGLVHLQYWVIANESVDSYIKEREESEIITYPSKEISYDPENPPDYLRFPLDDSPENSYTVYVKLVDGSVNENYTFMSFYACNIVREAKPTFTYKSDYQYAQSHYNICMDSDWHYHETASSNSYDRHPEWWTEKGLEYLWDDGYLNLSSLNITEEELVHRYIKDCYTYVTRPAFIYDVDFANFALLTVECFDGKNWDTGNFGFTGDVGVFDTQPAQFRQIAFAEAGGQYFEHNGANWDYRNVEYSYFYNVYNTEDFIRIKALEANGNGTIKNYLKTLYVYPKYYKGEMKVDNYNIQELGNGLQVFADAPVLAHTFYCSANLGKDIDLWLNHALETGVVQKDSTFTYGESYLKDVPQGKYYVTIVHFANGETAISDVKIKK